MIEEVKAWHSSIPGHWKRQYHPEHSADSDLIPPGPWTTILLDGTHSTQAIFYQQVLACIDTIEQLELWAQRWPLEALPLEYRQMIESRIRYLVKIICFIVRSNVGGMDSHGELKSRSNAQPSAKFANNTLYWPMQVVVDCPVATAEERTLCQLALHYIRPPTENTRAHRIARKNALQRMLSPDDTVSLEMRDCVYMRGIDVLLRSLTINEYILLALIILLLQIDKKSTVDQELRSSLHPRPALV